MTFLKLAIAERLPGQLQQRARRHTQLSWCHCDISSNDSQSLVPFIAWAPVHIDSSDQSRLYWIVTLCSHVYLGIYKSIKHDIVQHLRFEDCFLIPGSDHSLHACSHL
jgi:hypothetical protein